MKILCVSLTLYPGNSLSDLNLVKELSKTKNIITYAIKSNDMYKKYKTTNKNFYCGFPGFKKSDFHQIEQIKKINKVMFYDWTKLKELISLNDVIILGSYRQNEWIVSYARIRNKIVFCHKNPPEMHLDTDIMPNFYLLKDKFQKEYGSFINKYHRKFYKLDKKDRFITTGSVQYRNFFLDKKYNYKNFCRKYNLDYKKKLVLFLPSAPQLHNNYYKKLYKNICNKIDLKYNLLIKGHPTDYFKRKNSNNYNKNNSSWDELMPEKKVCDPKDFYEALDHSFAAVTINSTVFVEVNLSNKPVLFVETYDYLMNQLTGQEKNFDKGYYKNKIGWHSFSFSNRLIDYISKHGLLNKYNKSLIKNNSIIGVYKFFGQIIKIEDLSESLKEVENLNIYTDMKKNFGLNQEPIKYISKIILSEIKKNYKINKPSINFKIAILIMYINLKKMLKSLKNKYLK